MHGTGLLVDATTGLMLVVAALGAARLALASWLRMPSDRLVDGSHLTMGLGMAVMLSPGLVPGSPQWPWVALSAGWLLVLLTAALRDRRRPGSAPRSRLGLPGAGHEHHAVGAAAMLLMWLTTSPLDLLTPDAPVADAGDGMPGMTMRAGGGLSPTSFLALALFGLLLHRAAGLASRVGCGTGAAAADRTASSARAAERGRIANGPAGQRDHLRPAEPFARMMAPVWSHGCEVTMSLAMAGMLYLLV